MTWKYILTIMQNDDFMPRSWTQHLMLLTCLNKGFFNQRQITLFDKCIFSDASNDGFENLA